MDNPVTVNTTRFTMLLPVDTPEIPAVVPNQPTTRISTAPYMAWRIKAPSTGTINFNIFFKIFPRVKSFLLLSISFPLKFL